ncbi:MAG: rod-determining factor RdfA [Halobacteriota archaeon]
MGCKVDRSIETYGVTPTAGYDSLEAELLARWRGEGGRTPQGYRTLTEWFNKRLLKRVYDANARETVGTRLESEYEALVGDDPILRGEVRDDLQNDGIDAEAVLDAMVSWSTMRHHITGCLDAEKDPREPTNWEPKSVDIAIDRAREKLAAAVRSLDGKDRLAGGAAASVSIEAYVSCPVCGVRRRFTDAVDRGVVCETHYGSDDAAATADDTGREQFFDGASKR